jgi:hypothetical protein
MFLNILTLLLLLIEVSEYIWLLSIGITLSLLDFQSTSLENTVALAPHKSIMIYQFESIKDFHSQDLLLYL